jgi:hypothetical protein
MFKTKFQAIALSSLLAAGPALYSPDAHATNLQWVRNCTIASIAEDAGTIQIGIVKNGTINWLSMPTAGTTNAPIAARFLSSATAAWLSGKKIDVKVDFDGTGCGTTQSDCETVLSWWVH